jgi:hypothetical protein
VRGLGNASNRGEWHLLEFTLNSKLTTEIGGSAGPSCVLDMLPAHDELPAPTAHLRVKEGIAVSFEQLEMYLPALHAVPLADLHEETSFQMTVWRS